MPDARKPACRCFDGHGRASATALPRRCRQQDVVAERTADSTESRGGQQAREEVVAILAETLLGVLVPGAGRLGGDAENALIPASQHALLLTRKGRRGRSLRGRKQR